MVKIVLLLVVLGVVVNNVEAYSKKNNFDKNERDLIDVLRKTLALYESSRQRPGNGNGPFQNGNGPSQNGNGPSRNERRPRTNFKIDDLEKLYTFPGSNFMIRLLLNWLQEAPPNDPIQITDVVPVLDPTRLSNIQSVAPTLFEVVEDQEIFGEFMARILTKAVFDVHTQCPSALFYKFMARFWENCKSDLRQEGSRLFTVFNTKLPEFVPTITETPEMLQRTVAELVKHTWEHIVEDTESFILGLGFLGVARFSKAAYRRFVDPATDFRTSLPTIVENLITESKTTCQTGVDILEFHETAIGAFIAKFESEEDESIFDGLADNLEENISRFVEARHGEDAAEVLENANWEVLDNITTEIHEFIQDSVIPELSNFIEVIKQRNTEEFVAFFDFLDENTIAVLREVLRQLGWTTTPVVTDTPITDSTEGVTEGVTGGVTGGVTEIRRRVSWLSGRRFH